jgi:hypothetical protein
MALERELIVETNEVQQRGAEAFPKKKLTRKNRAEIEQAARDYLGCEEVEVKQGPSIILVICDGEEWEVWSTYRDYVFRSRESSSVPSADVWISNGREGE